MVNFAYFTYLSACFSGPAFLRPLPLSANPFPHHFRLALSPFGWLGLSCIISSVIYLTSPGFHTPLIPSLIIFSSPLVVFINLVSTVF
jgi:hypothetical protein